MKPQFTTYVQTQKHIFSTCASRKTFNLNTRHVFSTMYMSDRRADYQDVPKIRHLCQNMVACLGCKDKLSRQTSDKRNFKNHFLSLKSHHKRVRIVPYQRILFFILFLWMKNNFKKSRSICFVWFFRKSCVNFEYSQKYKKENKSKYTSKSL